MRLKKKEIKYESALRKHKAKDFYDLLELNNLIRVGSVVQQLLDSAVLLHQRSAITNKV